MPTVFDSGFVELFDRLTCSFTVLHGASGFPGFLQKTPCRFCPSFCVSFGASVGSSELSRCGGRCTLFFAQEQEWKLGTRDISRQPESFSHFILHLKLGVTNVFLLMLLHAFAIVFHCLCMSFGVECFGNSLPQGGTWSRRACDRPLPLVFRCSANIFMTF